MRASASFLINIQSGPSSGVVERGERGSIWPVQFSQAHQSGQMHNLFEGLAIWMVGRKADYPILF